MKNPVFLGAMENIFTLEEKPGHEIVLVLKGDFDDPSFYRNWERVIIENGRPCEKAAWIPSKEFRAGRMPLYPEGLLDFLSNKLK